jgi:hypothetical protein
MVVSALLVRECSSLRLVDTGRSEYRLRCPIAQSHLSSMPWGGPRGQRPQLGRVIESWRPPSGRGRAVMTAAWARAIRYV